MNQDELSGKSDLDTEKTETLRHGAKTLLDEADRLSGTMPAVADEIISLWGEIRILLESITASDDDETRRIFESISEKNQKLSTCFVQQLDKLDKLLSRYRDVSAPDILERIQTGLRLVDPTKLADEYILSRSKAAMEAVLQAPDQWAIQIAVTHIPIFLLVHAHSSALKVFLGRPSTLMHAAEVGKSLLKAALFEAAGTMIPGLGIIEACVQATEPQIEREIKKIQTTATQLNRIFLLRRTFDELVAFTNYVEANIDATDGLIKDSIDTFLADSSWLVVVLETAVREK
jgi:hypothetical protein